MDEQKILQFIAHYRTLPEEALAQLHARSDTLTEEAGVALDRTISARRINLLQMAQDEAEQDFVPVATIVKEIEEKEKRDARNTKFFLLFGIPLIFLQLIFDPGKFVQIAVEALCLGLLAWLILIIRRRMRRRS